jgi:hypothetical protein
VRRCHGKDPSFLVSNSYRAKAASWSLRLGRLCLTSSEFVPNCRWL